MKTLGWTLLIVGLMGVAATLLSSHRAASQEGPAVESSGTVTTVDTNAWLHTDPAYFTNIAANVITTLGGLRLLLRSK